MVMSHGLRFELNGEYRPMTISPLSARKCWEREFQHALLDIAGETFPQAVFDRDSSGPFVMFSKVNKRGIEILKGSKPFDKRTPSTSEVERVQEEIERLHAMANDESIPLDRREFFRNLQLPNPHYMPECWRTTGFFRKKLYIIWGLTKGGRSTFLPASRNADSWGDRQNRTTLCDALGMSGSPLTTGHDHREGGSVSSGSRVGSSKTDGHVNRGAGCLPISSNADSRGDRQTPTTLPGALGVSGGPSSTNHGRLEGNGISSGSRAGNSRTVVQVNGGDGRSRGFVDGLLNVLTFGRYGHRNGDGSRGGCLGAILGFLMLLLIIMLIVSLFRGGVPGCTPGSGSEFTRVSDRDVDNPSGPRTGVDEESDRGSIAGDNGRSQDSPSDSNEGTTEIEQPKPNTGKNDQGNAGNGRGSNNESAPPVLPPERRNRGREEVSNLDSAKALVCHFRVNPPKELPGSDGDVAKVEFTISPINDLGVKDYEVSDWRINGEVKRPGVAPSFIPEEGLRFDKAYTISAIVTVDGKPQRVEPFQWNTVDAPTWQILEFGRDVNSEMRQYKLVCCNSSSIKPKVKDWKVEFRTNNKDGEKKLDFKVESNRVGDNVFEMRKSIGFFEGTYFMEMTALIDYEFRGKIKSVTHVEIFPFTHDSSADGLTKAKYEVVIPNVYFCLAKLEDGSLINGTAFAISDKLLLSNYHVAVGGIPECYANSGNYKVHGLVTLTNVKGKTFYAKVDRFDRGRDLALLRLCDKTGKDTDDRLPGYLHLAENALVSGINESATRHVFAIGYPKGTVCMGPPAFTDGKAEKVFKRDYNWRGKHQTFDTILNYTSTKCGYSGGPLIDYKTEAVLGVNFGGLIEKMEGHKAASLATSAAEVRLGFPNLEK